MAVFFNGAFGDLAYHIHPYIQFLSALKTYHFDSFLVCSLDILSTADDGATWTLEKTLSVPTGATSFDVGHLDNAGSTGTRRGLDIVVGGGDTLTVYYADDFPIASGDAAPSLANWGTVSSTTSVVSTGYAIERVLVAPFDGSGYSSILFTARDSSGNTKREIVYSTDATADARDLSGVTPTNIQLSDEAGEQIIAIIRVDANNDGAIDYIYAYQDGRTELVLSVPAARTDLSSLSDPTNGIVGHLAAELNPTNTPSELICRETPSDASCVTNTDGAWIRTNSNVGGDVSQWGDGHILTDSADQTITVGSPVSPGDSTVSDHGPQCALPGSNVVPVETTFYIEFPVVKCAPKFEPNIPHYYYYSIQSTSNTLFAYYLVQVPCIEPGPHCVSFSNPQNAHAHIQL